MGCFKLIAWLLPGRPQDGRPWLIDGWFSEEEALPADVQHMPPCSTTLNSSDENANPMCMPAHAWMLQPVISEITHRNTTHYSPANMHAQSRSHLALCLPKESGDCNHSVHHGCSALCLSDALGVVKNRSLRLHAGAHVSVCIPTNSADSFGKILHKQRSCVASFASHSPPTHPRSRCPLPSTPQPQLTGWGG